MRILKFLCYTYFQNSKELSNKPIKLRAPIIWGDEEIEQLKKLYEEFKDAVDPVNRIIDHLIVKRPKKRVIEKIMGKLCILVGFYVKNIVPKHLRPALSYTHYSNPSFGHFITTYKIFSIFSKNFNSVLTRKGL